MTRDEWDGLVKKINLAWPGSPLGDNQSNVYFTVLKDADADELSEVIVELVRDGASSPPPPNRLLRLVAERSGPEEAALAITLRPVTSSTAPTTPIARPTPPGRPTPPTATPVATPGAVPVPPPREGLWSSHRMAVIGISALALCVGVGAGAGIAMAVAPDADAAYAQGKSEGYDSGYDDGKDEGYDSGYAAGKTGVFTSLTGGTPIDGEYYIVQYDEDDGISSWFSSPLMQGWCYRINGSTVTRSILC